MATRTHEGQFRRDGITPYIVHPQGVVDILREWGYDDEFLVVGYLHDTLEEGLTLNELKSHHEFSAEIIDAVIAITKTRRESYDEYLNRVVANNIAKIVKLADIKHNLCDRPTFKQIEKYKKAVQFITHRSAATAARRQSEKRAKNQR